MKAFIDIGRQKLEVDFSKGMDISIPLLFNGDQLTHIMLIEQYLKLMKMLNLLETQEKVGLVILRHIILPHIVTGHILNALVI